jgi:hypothetical protein
MSARTKKIAKKLAKKAKSKKSRVEAKKEVA